MDNSIRSWTDSVRKSTQAAIVLLVAAIFAPVDMRASEGPPNPPRVCQDDCSSTEDRSAYSVVKWNPGHYFMPGGKNSFEGDQIRRFALYDSFGDNPNIQGVTLRVGWNTLERDSKGNYQPGFDFIDSELEKLASLKVPKRLWLRIQTGINIPDGEFLCYDKTYRYSLSNSKYAFFPAYVRNSSLTTRAQVNKCTVKLWDSSLINHYVDLLKAYAARYDNHPLFEGVSIIKESALGNDWDEGSGYSASGYISGMKKLSLASKAAWRRTNVVLNTNAIPSGSIADRNDLISWQIENGIGQGGPDLAPHCISNDAPDCSFGFVEPQTSSLGTVYQFIKDNNRGNNGSNLAPIAYSIEVSELGSNAVGQYGGYSPKALYEFCTSWGLNCNHMFWHHNVWAGVDSQKWSTGILPFINQNPSLPAECPQSLVKRGGCITGSLPE